MGRPLIDISGRKFGRWTVICRDETARSGTGIHPKWVCKCECGNSAFVYGTLLVAGTSRSCGCLQREGVIKRSTKHGIYGTPLYWRIYGSSKRAKKLNATPGWADFLKIKEIYKNRPDGCHVDHIVPLNSPLVCGLHWEGNLQYLPAKENCSKRNRLMEEHYGKQRIN